MAFVDYWNELRGVVPKLSAPLAQKLVNRAWQDICGSRLWSFLVAEMGLSSPAAINSGTVAVVQGSPSVTADAVIAKPLLTAAYTNPSNPLITRQFRLPYGPVYRILAYSTITGIITLDRPYMEPSNATAGYLVYKCYFSPGTTDFIRWLAVGDPNNGYSLNQRRFPTKEALDRVDPQRGSQGLAYYIAQFEYDQVNHVPLFEFWPHPTGVQSFQCLYQRKGLDLSSSNDLPPTIPAELLLMRSRYRAYEWAETNKGLHPELRGTDWKYLMKMYEDARSRNPNSYAIALMRARKIDEEIRIRNVKNIRRTVGFPVDSAFIQSHDVDRMG